MTPEERAAEITKGWGLIRVEISPRTASESPYLVIENGGQWARSLIADAIRAAELAALERCARVAEQRACFHRDNCHQSCACADGWHIAMAIRSGIAAGSGQ
ncbi:MAG: hypothetical protein K2X91_01465 [Thermoleophilia bacterium]|nr:hypothetical protein [Thermoleophilia bacterium]